MRPAEPIANEVIETGKCESVTMEDNNWHRCLFESLASEFDLILKIVTVFSLLLSFQWKRYTRRITKRVYSGGEGSGEEVIAFALRIWTSGGKISGNVRLEAAAAEEEEDCHPNKSKIIEFKRFFLSSFADCSPSSLVFELFMESIERTAWPSVALFPQRNQFSFIASPLSLSRLSVPFRRFEFK